MLARPREELLYLGDLPPKPDNTARFDAVGFDVPIVKLDEWIEGGIAEEIVEDWLFKPSLMEEPEPEEEEPQKTGRRRRRRGGRGGSEEPLMAPKEFANEEPFDDLGMHVVFRKRD